MQNKIKALLFTYGKARRLIEDYDNHIENYAVASSNINSSRYVSTMAQFDRLYQLIDRKRRILNLKVLFDDFSCSLNDNFRTLLFERYVQFKGYRKSIFKNVFTRQQYFRMVESLLKKVDKFLKAKELGEEWFDNEYLELDIVKSLLNAVDKGWIKHN